MDKLNSRFGINRLTCLFFFLTLVNTHVFAQQTYVLGKAIDKTTRKGVPSATVVNKNTRQITRTGENGNFLVKASKGDSIKISSVGYKNAGIEWDGVTTEPVIEMPQDAIMLPEVTIKDRRLEIIRKQIDELLAAPEASNKMKWKDISNLINTNTTLPNGGIGISIDGLYQLFSKEGKTRRKLEAMKQEDLRKLLVEYRYNAEYVSYVTKLKGQELKNFMKYCNLPDTFILTANDYDLTFEVFRCLEDYKTRLRF
ncbi:carboxypeptidase-like regulatory domain-containing protein [Emticicia sp. 21SJ11W-3]|uniref:carboxypeptidase-like regulatory domain-containing protein n=1 Tax=Emticicia sp. 21SJ11W-3 TaxID=2916755 RepID=UPI0020A13BCE|nr:carboxypeptidase-like regulatory domain-containing protein [Emticicia sp. 21SJ11W-3]UTA68250.1 carboxypeptidase-like regulatory domain-containing protein [Emticicia sp. 21SJ11W-3]